ncbi:MAG: amidohydrolase, partial [Candidatus Cloacimonetes bacterium]|nr:amidohydrolase [Candidatus Cloacimonadota bacterium]
MAQKKTLIFKASILYDGINKSSDKYVIVEDGLITEITAKPVKADYTGILTPAFIDPHSHIGLDREGEPWQESEVNDHIDQINPL